MAENMDQARRDDKEKRGEGWVSLIIRFVIAAIVLMVTAWLTPGFSRMGFGTALVAALVIAAMDWVVQRVFKIDASPFGRGIVGFIVSAIIIYLTQFLVPGMSISIWGAVIASLIIGIIDAILPVNVV
ncbi:MAG TPA: phage holin family protein [Clostridiales bacterium]|jgi:putative membrane protein|nr:phage holin family protein [Clostridiales bacterium]